MHISVAQAIENLLYAHVYMSVVQSCCFQTLDPCFVNFEVQDNNHTACMHLANRKSPMVLNPMYAHVSEHEIQCLSNLNSVYTLCSQN